MKPTIGRIVHYVSKIDNGPGNEVVSPAIVIATRSNLVPSVIERWGPEPTEVGPSPVDGKSHLTARRPDVEIALRDDETVHLLVHGLGKDYREYGVKHDEDCGLGTWHWPEREVRAILDRERTAHPSALDKVTDRAEKAEAEVERLRRGEEDGIFTSVVHECCERVEKAEAAIARVRALCDESRVAISAGFVVTDEFRANVERDFAGLMREHLGPGYVDDFYVNEAGPFAAACLYFVDLALRGEA